MAKEKKDAPLMIRCPNCKQTREPDLNETTHRYVCPVCAAPVDAQVIIEKKKRKGGNEENWRL
jgi:Zn finger protein HypA/HybF involved in hydrogenase expression